MPDETLPPPADEPQAPAPAAAEVVPPAELGPAAEVAADSPEPSAAAQPEAAAEAPAEAEAPAVAATEPAAAPAVPELSPAACAALLGQHFPALFGPGVVLPIKLRIQADIQARVPGVFTRKSMSLFLHRHTTSTAYLKALVAAPTRFDLDGAAAGEIAAEHREAANVELARRWAIVQAKRAAERQAQRPPRASAAAAEPGAPAATGEQPPQPPRGDRPPRPPRHDRPAGARPEGGRPDNRQRRPEGPPGGRRDGPPQRQGQPARPMQQRPQQRPQQPRPERPPEHAETRLPDIPGLSPAELEARRDRAALLRAYEGSTLTRANFCVLKRISEAELEAQLATARQERESRPPRVRPQN